MSKPRFTFGFVVAWLLVGALAVADGTLGARGKRASLQAVRAAVAFATEDTAALAGVPADAATPAYAAVDPILVDIPARDAPQWPSSPGRIPPCRDGWSSDWSRSA